MSFNGLRHFFFNSNLKNIKNSNLYSILIYPTSFVPIFQTCSYVTSKFQLKISILIKSISRYLSLLVYPDVLWDEHRVKKIAKGKRNMYVEHWTGEEHCWQWRGDNGNYGHEKSCRCPAKSIFRAFRL